MVLHKKLERISKEWRTIFDSTSDMIVLIDREMNITKANLAVSKFANKEIKGIIGEKCYKIFHYKDEPPDDCPFSILKEIKKRCSNEFYLPEKSIWLEHSIEPVFDNEGNLTYSILIIRDITDKKIVENELLWRLKFEKLIAKISSRFIYNTDINVSINDALRDIGVFCNASRAYLFLFRNELKLVDNTHEWCAEGVTPQIDNLKNISTEMYPWAMHKLKRNEVIHVKDVSLLPEEASTEKKSAEEQDIKSFLILPLFDERELIGAIGLDNVRETKGWREEDLMTLRVCSDYIVNAIKRKEAEKKLKNYQEQLRLLNSKLLISEEKERRKIATDIHDNIIQNLAICKIKLKSMQQTSLLNYNDSFNEILKIIDNVIKCTRTLTFDLASPILYELGFKASIEWLGEEIFKKNDIMFDFVIEANTIVLSEDKEILLYQVLKELFTNILKHANATYVELKIYIDNGLLNIILKDDGIGFDVSKIESFLKKNFSFGLFSVRERIISLGGFIDIESAVNSGTKIHITLPILEYENKYNTRR